MIEDITSTYDRRVRQRYSSKVFDSYYLKELVYKDCNLSGLIKAYIKDNITFESRNKVYRITDNDFKNCLINEANLQFNKALYNWSAYKRLVSKGLWSWAFVTLYYAQFYCINGLLNLQGTAFSRPKLLTEEGEEKEEQFHIYPENFREGIFIFEMRRLNKPHEDIWRQYYESYRDFRFNLPEYNELYQYDRENQYEDIPMC